jgi:hypothetical protein
MSELQVIIDSLARRIGRPVTVDDPGMRLIAHSVQTGGIDDGRLESILARKAPDGVISWLHSLDIANSKGARRISANKELGTLSRVCVPLRYGSTLIGYLWIIDADSSLTSNDLAVVSSGAEEVGSLLYQESLLAQLERGRERELLRDLLSDQSSIRRYAAEELVKEGIFAAGLPVVALIIRPERGDGAAWADQGRLRMSEVLDGIRMKRPARRSMQLMRPDHGLLVAAVTDAGKGQEEALTLASQVHASLTHPDSSVECDNVLIGVGDAQELLCDLVFSYSHALQAGRVGEIMPRLGPIISWPQLGVYRTLSYLAVEGLTEDALHPGLLGLLRDPNGSWLVETLERFLDNAGDAATTASDLSLHRASLYYRLRRIEQVAGVDLRKGEDRLALHLGLRLARLVCIFPENRQGGQNEHHKSCVSAKLNKGF